MEKILSLFRVSKRQKFVLVVSLLSLSLFLSEFLGGQYFIAATVILSIATDIALYLILKDDIQGTFFYPIFILPFLYTFAFNLFYSLVPARILSRMAVTLVYGFGLYSLFLTQNIFAVSGIRTINLLRSARIVSFVLTLVILFFLINVSFSLRLPIIVLPLLVLIVSLLLSFQSLWVYVFDRTLLPEIFLAAGAISFSLMELSLILILWPVNASIYSIFLTGVFYAYSGVINAWIEKRLFKGILWEYIWIGSLSIMILLFFSKWGI